MYDRTPESTFITIAGQAVLYASLPIAACVAATWVVFQIVVVASDEPHLLGKTGSWL